MLKIWTSHEKNDDRIIAFANNTIYKGSPPATEVDLVVMALQSGNCTHSSLFEIPLSYCKEFRLREGKNYIEILFGHDSEEHLKITDRARRNEVFEFLESALPNTSHVTGKYTAIRAGKKPLIALAILPGIFIWVLNIAIGMESGSEYEVVGSAHSLAGIVLMIASIGVTNVVLLFGSLIAIAIASFILKAKNPPVISRLIIKR